MPPQGWRRPLAIARPFIWTLQQYTNAPEERGHLPARPERPADDRADISPRPRPERGERWRLRPPSVTRILVAVGFAISCFALALFLWLAFGGPIPLKPEGYRVTVPFQEATQLAQESDVRISGRLGRQGEEHRARRRRLRRRDDRARPGLRADPRGHAGRRCGQKTLLGETYVELTPGSEEAESLPEGGRLPPAQVAESVQLDEIFRTFDPRTRAAFQDWMQGQAAALRGRGDDFSIAIASLPSFADQTDRLLRLLDSQDVALSSFVREGGEAFGALSERSGELRGTIENSAEVFATTAERNQELADIFRIFPTFLRESRATLARLEQFAVDTDPVVVGLRPAARELTPTLLEIQRLAPVLDTFFTGLLGTTEVGPRGLKATRQLLDNDLPPILEGFDPWLADFNAILEVFASTGSSSPRWSPTSPPPPTACFSTRPSAGRSTTCARRRRSRPRRSRPIPNRLQLTRTNPYFKSGALLDLATGLESFETAHCTSGLSAFLDPNSPADPAFNSRVGGDAAEAQQFFDRLKLFAFNDQLGTPSIAAPPCDQQGPYESIGAGSELSQYLHVRELP